MSVSTPRRRASRSRASAFRVQGAKGFSGREIDDLAADQMTTLLDQTDRFRKIERAQLDRLIAEQDLKGIVKAREMARPGMERGVDFLLIGRVTNLRVKAEQSEIGTGFVKLGGFIDTGGFDYKNKSNKITTECGVDIRLVDPTSGEAMTTNFSEYQRTDSISSFGAEIPGFDAKADNELQIQEDDRGLILRIALDDAVWKMLPTVDKFLSTS